MALTLNSLSPHTGVEAHGVDLRKPLGPQTRARLNEAFARHSVLVIRNQQLTAPQLLAAVKQFGKVFEQHNTRFSLPDCPQIHYISNHDRYPDGTRYIPGAGYHTDHSNSPAPPKATVLHAVELPDKGGDTQFVNMHLAYDRLSSSIKNRIANLQARHVYQSPHSERKLMGLSRSRQQQVELQAVHPLVRIHPETKRKSVYLNPIRIDQIEGMPEPDALRLLDELLEHCVQDAHQYRHRWQVGDVTLWDNRCLLHKANGDYDMRQTRYLYRVMLEDGALR